MTSKTIAILAAFACLFMGCSDDSADKSTGANTTPSNDTASGATGSDGSTVGTDVSSSPADTSVQTDDGPVGDTGTLPSDATSGTDAAGTQESDCNANNPDNTVGLKLCNKKAYPGYTLLAPNSSKKTWLLDIEGQIVHEWLGSYRPGHSVYLLENGNLLRTGNPGPMENNAFKGGGIGGHMEELDWDGNVVWDYMYSTKTYRAHHDIELLPNGNVLIVAWELRSKDEALAAGRNPEYLKGDVFWPDQIVEVERTGNTIVWEWHFWDHLVQDFDESKLNFGVVAEHPELLDINFPPVSKTKGEADWIHVNSVAYNAALDQIVISGHNTSEIYVIDHSTTTAEAASHSGGKSGKGGDFLYRWGNALAYDSGTKQDQTLFLQHDAQWIPEGRPGAGNMLIFSNGNAQQKYSSVVEIKPPLQADGSYALDSGKAYGPSTPVWEYTAPNKSDFFADHISGAQRLPNGNTLICSGPQGRLFEVTAEKEIVWEYINPVVQNGVVAQGQEIPTNKKGKATNSVFRAYRYGVDYPGLQGKTLMPSGNVERSLQ